MARTLARAAAAVALGAASAVVLATRAHAMDCVTVDGDPVLCAGADAGLDPDTSNGATVSPAVDVDVCSSLVPRASTCAPSDPTLSAGATGVLLNGTSVAPATIGGIPVHVPEVCLNTNPCVGPYDDTTPPVDVVCVTRGNTEVVVGGTVTQPLPEVGTC